MTDAHNHGILTSYHDPKLRYRVINNESINLEVEHRVVSEKSSDDFNIGHCLIKVKIMAQIFLHLPHYTNCQA